MNKLRRTRGSAITETGVCLWLFLIAIFFPLLDVIFLTMQVACAWYLNHETIRELCVTRPPAANLNTAIKNVQTNFNTQTGIMKFMKVVAVTETYIPTQQDATQAGHIATMQLGTTVQAQPFLQLPVLWLQPIPGLNANFIMTFYSSRPWEVSQPGDPVVPTNTVNAYP